MCRSLLLREALLLTLALKADLRHVWVQFKFFACVLLW